MSDGLFDDLEELPHEEIEDKAKQLERDLRSLDDEFNSKICEVHHTTKIDSPSGTALKIKKDIDSVLKKDTSIESKRIGSNNGTHEVIYESFSDFIKITHIAKNRDSFALGSVVCAEWIISQNGFFQMDDFLNDFL